jgi:predicted AAA+ superfamily ATPase
LLRHENPDLVIDLLDPELQLSFNKNPNLLLQQIEDIEPNKKIKVLIDEVQRVPKLLDIVHLLMERRREIQFILCGSSARKLRHGASNLLGGRALYRSMFPLTLEEMDTDFHLETVLTYGSLPKVYTTLKENNEALAQDLLRAYVITYLKEEVKAEALVRNLSGFQNFLDVAVAQFGEQINFSAVSRDCQVALSTVREYYTILEDTLIGYFLYPYLKSQRKRMSHQPRFYFFDNGVTRALLGTLRDPPDPREKDRLLEQWILQEIIRLNEYKQMDWKLSFWRTSHGAEVDIVVSRGKNPLFAIECKHTKHLSNAHLTGLKSFRDVYPNVPCYIVAPVNQPSRLSFARVLPPETLLQELV